MAAAPMTMNFSGVFAAPLDIQGGILGGSGTIAATVTVAGSLAPGLPPGAPSPGALTIAGTYTQTAAGSYDVELGGLAPGTEHDTVAVSGPAVLAGTLNVTLVNGFIPQDRDTFTIMTFPSSAGAFAPANLPVLGGDLVWKIHYNPTSIVLEVLADLDGDGVRNASDCRPLDPTVWAAPDEASGVTFTAGGQMSWSSLAAQAGPATIYDVVRGLVSELPVGSGSSEICLATGVTAAQVTDTSSPPRHERLRRRDVRHDLDRGAARHHGVPLRPGALCVGQRQSSHSQRVG